MICKVADCSDIAKAQGLCSKHYQRYKKYGDPEFTLITPKGLQAGLQCLITHCKAPAKYKGLCKKHYKRQWRHGDPEKTLINMDNLPKLCKVEGCEAFARYPSSGFCHPHHIMFSRYGRTERIRAKAGEPRKDSVGYVVLVENGRFVYEHIRVAEIMNGGPLPKGAVVHHKNRIKSDNRQENLQIMESQAAHMRLHAEEDKLMNRHRPNTEKRDE